MTYWSFDISYISRLAVSWCLRSSLSSTICFKIVRYLLCHWLLSEEGCSDAWTTRARFESCLKRVEILEEENIESFFERSSWLRRWEDMIENIKKMLSEVYRNFNAIEKLQCIDSDINEMWITIVEFFKRCIETWCEMRKSKFFNVKTFQCIVHTSNSISCETSKRSAVKMVGNLLNRLILHQDTDV